MNNRQKISVVRYCLDKMTERERTALINEVISKNDDPALQVNITELRQIRNIGDRTAREILLAVALALAEARVDWSGLVDGNGNGQ